MSAYQALGENPPLLLAHLTSHSAQLKEEQPLLKGKPQLEIRSQSCWYTALTSYINSYSAICPGQ